MNNGLYVQGIVKGVRRREFTKRETGELFVFHTLVLETDPLVNPICLELGRDAVNAGLVREFSGALIGKTVLVPFWIKRKDSYVGYQYDGAARPHVVTPSADVKQAS